MARMLKMKKTTTTQSNMVASPISLFWELVNSERSWLALRTCLGNLKLNWNWIKSRNKNDNNGRLIDGIGVDGAPGEVEGAWWRQSRGQQAERETVKRFPLDVSIANDSWPTLVVLAWHPVAS